MIKKILSFAVAILAFVSFSSLAHAAVPGGINLPKPANELAQTMYNFHTYWLLPIVFIVSLFVIVIMAYICIRFSEKNNPVPANFTHNVKLEVVWTLVPTLILIVLAVPSINLLRATDDLSGSEMTIKVTGYQWYWNYAYPDHGELNFDSYLIEEKELTPEQYRLMSVDQPLVIPVNTRIRMQFTGGDVLHSWAVQDFGVRMDAVPGLLNEFPITPVFETGVYYGFCSELCGNKHAYMPIEVHVLEKDQFQAWLSQAQDAFAQGNVIKRPEVLFANQHPYKPPSLAKAE